jgi:hypothetical protein
MKMKITLIRLTAFPCRVDLPNPEKTKTQGGHGRFCQLFALMAQGGYYSGYSNLFNLFNVRREPMALNLEPVYQEIFTRFKTRKKFVIQKVENNVLTVEQDEEICGQKEPKIFEFKSPKEFEAFVHQENLFEKDIENQLSGNQMPYR